MRRYTWSWTALLGNTCSQRKQKHWWFWK